jgi:hypothetical protein
MEWFAVRHVIGSEDAFEERITLWRAASAEEAIAHAEREAAEYANTVAGRGLDLFQSYRRAFAAAEVVAADGTVVQGMS